MPLPLNVGNKKYSVAERLNMKQLDLISVTATTDAETIGDNKVIAQSIEIPYATSVSGGVSTIKSVTVLDEVATGPAIDIVFSSSSSAITQDEGKAVGEDVDDLDTVFESALGVVSLAAGDYTDLFDAKVGTKSNIDLVIQSAATSSSIYMHIINRSGGNWVATATTNMVVKVGILKD
tara:strand:+ start:1056 stop:1589 length:534 start_codon:yes stop_codon:yes gene_type:complete